MPKEDLVQLNGLSDAAPHGRKLYRVLIVLGALIVLGFFLFPPLAPLDKANLVGYAICHQIPERSFFLGGHRLPLCARCTGTYLGVGVGFGALALLRRWRTGELLPTWMLVLMAGFIAAMGVDGFNSYLDLILGHPLLYEPQNWLRAVTGSLNGIALSMILMPILNTTLWKQPAATRPLRNGWELLGVVAAAGTLVALVQSEPAWLLYPVAILTTVGVVWMLSAVNTMILLIVFRHDSQAETWQQVAPALLGGLVTALAELAIIGTARYLLTGTLSWPVPL
ncbi:MAG: DUF2085 domain-containing protein [Anaerolineae bacterium]